MGNSYYPYRPTEVLVCSDSGKKKLKRKTKLCRNFRVDPECGSHHILSFFKLSIVLFLAIPLISILYFLERRCKVKSPTTREEDQI